MIDGAGMVFLGASTGCGTTSTGGVTITTGGTTTTGVAGGCGVGVEVTTGAGAEFPVPGWVAESVGAVDAGVTGFDDGEVPALAHVPIPALFTAPVAGIPVAGLFPVPAISPVLPAPEPLVPVPDCTVVSAGKVPAGA